jgi:hypothetical protein
MRQSFTMLSVLVFLITTSIAVDARAQTPVITGTDYDVIAHGGQLVLFGTNLTGATQVSIGGVVHTNLIDLSDTSLAVAAVDDLTPIAANLPVVVLAAGGQSAAFFVTVIHLVISEIEPDSPGLDLHEFIELATGLSEPVSLAGYLVVFFNGAANSGAVIDIYDLGAGGAVTTQAGLFLIGSSNLAVTPELTLTASIQSGEDAAAIYQFPAGPGSFPADYPTVGNTGLIDAVIWESGSDTDATTLWPLMLNSGGVIDEGPSSAARQTATIQRCESNPTRRDDTTFRREIPSPGSANLPCGAPAALPSCTLDFSSSSCPIAYPGICGVTFAAHGAAQCHGIGIVFCDGGRSAFHTLAADSRIDVFLSGTLENLDVFLAPYLASNATMSFYDIDGNLLDTASSTQDCNISPTPSLSLGSLGGTRRIEIRGNGDIWVDDFQIINTNDPDTDGDGLSDGAETFIHGTDPGDADSDDDGLDDGDEVNVHNTDPLDSDSDDDGFADGIEVSAGSDPNDPGSVPAASVPMLGFAARVLIVGLLFMLGVWMTRKRSA